jgi:hypothetical protein
MGGACNTYGKEKRVLMWKLEGKGPLGRSRHIWEDNIEWLFKKWDVDMWTGLGNKRNYK